MALPGHVPLYLAGPTASGKSAVALALAEQLGGEIISVDSMQVYRGLDVGTAKPSPAERARVPHHLIDVANPDQPFSAADFVRLARSAVTEIQRHGRVPIFCGGTGLYFKAWLAGLGEVPGPDPTLRAALEAIPLPALLEELRVRDPETFARIDRANPRRVVRAVEVLRLTGRPWAALRAAWDSPPVGPAGRPVVIWGLRRHPADLRARLEARVESMFAAGLVEETRRLLEHGLARNRTALQALGYRQVVEYLRGQRGLAETVARVKHKTWQFARRQLTWFRHQLPVDWLDVAPEEPPEVTARRILTRCDLRRVTAPPDPAPTGPPG